jgi:PIN domain nuclease of toxin-antitoxin system
MPGLRLLLRMAPFVVGVVAASVWLRRRAAARKRLPAGPPVPQIESPRQETGAEQPKIEPSKRFQREPIDSFEREPIDSFEREPIDIVTVVDDLLLAGR